MHKNLTYRLVSRSLVASALLFSFYQTIAGADIKIRGYIYSSATNTPLAGATAELLKNGLNARSDSKGYFIIQATSVSSRHVSISATTIRINGTILSFAVPEGPETPVAIHASDLSGRNIPLFKGMVAAGSHTLDIAGALHAPGVYLLQTSLCGFRNTRMVCIGLDGMFSSANDAAAGAIAGASAASTVAAASSAWDTLVVSDANYITEKVPLATSLDSVAKVMLHPDSTSPSAGPIGFATVDGSTTGGGTVSPTTVKTLADLKAATADQNPRVIIVSGAINATDVVQIASNKTLVGADRNAKIYGGIAMSGVSNVIVRNLNIQGVYPNSGAGDAVAVVSSAHHIWIDHCNIWDAPDGNLDITKQANYVTVSWCKFWYTSKDHPHRFNGLIGAGGGTVPADWGKLKVTFHHNWFADLVDQRMPRLMYGQAHVFNDYYTCTGNLYCIGVGSYGAALVENNYFKNVTDPHVFMYDVYCHITARGNVYDNITGAKDTGLGGSRKETGQDFDVTAFTDPPYKYTADKAEDVPNLVSKSAGPQ
jgi:pectate lyase